MILIILLITILMSYVLYSDPDTNQEFVSITDNLVTNLISPSAILDVIPINSHKGVSVRSVLFMHESKRMKKFMDNNLDIDASTLLETNLKPATSSPVWKLGIASATSRNDVNIVNLICSFNKPINDKLAKSSTNSISSLPNAGVVFHVLKSCSYNCSLI